MFKWPNVFDIWNTYLTKFLARYGGSKLERSRDLFEQCLDGCPDKYAKTFFLLYANLEEEHGLARHTMSVYERATKSVPASDRFDMYNLYIKKASEIYGVTQTRSIYQRAIEELPDHQAREMCLRFADLERTLGEIDRARAIYGHCSQMCDPRVAPGFWEVTAQFIHALSCRWPRFQCQQFDTGLDSFFFWLKCVFVQDSFDLKTFQREMRYRCDVKALYKRGGAFTAAAAAAFLF